MNGSRPNAFVVGLSLLVAFLVMVSILLGFVYQKRAFDREVEVAGLDQVRQIMWHLTPLVSHALTEHALETVEHELSMCTFAGFARRLKPIPHSQNF